MRIYKASILVFFSVFLFFYSCEKEFIPDAVVDAGNIVVEGYIEAGDQPTPPYVILTKSMSFFQEISPEQLEENFVHDATITISDGEKSVSLIEVCLDEVPEEQRKLAGQLFGIDVDEIGVNFCAYVDLTFSMTGQVGKTYNLKIEHEGKILTASTSIPEPVPLDSLWFVDAPGTPNDTLAQLRCFINDPESLTSYFRYFTKINDGPFESPFSSVFDDGFFNGKSFEFPLAKAEPRNQEIDPSTFGLFIRGDTVEIKWTTIDRDHYDFWNTLEFNAANQGPFSNYTRIDSNVEGGLGIWGGSVASYYSMIVPEE